MNIQPLYDVKERLEQAAIAGTGLLGEDFRLQRAAEGLKPLAAASPVFGKIDAGLTGLLTAPGPERAGLLLDSLALVDAVVYTQAKTGAEGELTSLPAGNGQYRELSYGQLNPLLTALTTTGGGRMETVQSSWESRPEIFTDFRVLPAVVAGLGDSYGELAELNAKILKGAGPAALPLLKEGFDPAGNKAMARRVEVISALEGAGATPWLKEVLPQAKKDVRAAVLTALGEDPENVPLLLELAKTERGANREAVLKALAKQDGAAVRDFWTAEVEKRAESVEFLGDSSADWASDLAAAALRTEVEALFARGEKITPEDRLKLNRVRWACLGKTSPAMLDCWRWMDSTLNSGEKMKGVSGQLMNLSGESAEWLLDSLCAAGPGPLCDLSREFWNRNRDRVRYLPHAILSALLSRPAAEVFGEFSPYAERLGKVRGGQVLTSAFGHIFWNKKEGCYQASRDYYNVLAGNSARLTVLYEPLDRRWFDLLFSFPDVEDILRRLIPPEDGELQGKLINYQCRKILENGYFTPENVAFLRRQGLTDWKGFLDKKVRKDGSLTTYAVVNLLNETSLSGPEKAQELRNLYKIVQEQHAMNKRPTWPEQRVRELIAAWEAE